MDAWIAAEAERIAAAVPEQLARLVAVSSPSGDLAGAEAAIAVVRTLLPEGAEVERVPCSTPGHADDFLARARGGGGGAAVRRGRAAARQRRGVADGPLRPPRALRRLRRLPVLRGRAAR